WELARLAAHVDLDVLRVEAVDERIIQAAERELEAQAMSPEEREGRRRTIEAEWANERDAWDADETRPLTLAELLQRPAAETDATLQANAFELQTQVGAL